jgi:phosphatidylglycerophosphatase A
VATGLLALALGPTGWPLQLAIAGMGLLACVLCVLTGPAAQATFGKKDPGQCNIDEWAGQCLTLMALPMGHSAGSVALTLAVGFVSFRVFDIIKPPPVHQVEKLPLGWGVLLDDLIAGVMANFAAQLLLRFVLT